MKVKELIKLLEVCHPESQVLCSWMGDSERDADYRAACSYLVLYDNTPVGTGADALQSFSITGATVQDSSVSQDLEGMECVLSIEQDYFLNRYVNENIENVRKARREFNK